MVSSSASGPGRSEVRRHLISSYIKSISSLSLKSGRDIAYCLLALFVEVRSRRKNGERDRFSDLTLHSLFVIAVCRSASTYLLRPYILGLALSIFFTLAYHENID